VLLIAGNTSEHIPKRWREIIGWIRASTQNTIKTRALHLSSKRNYSVSLKYLQVHVYGCHFPPYSRFQIIKWNKIICCIVSNPGLTFLMDRHSWCTDTGTPSVYFWLNLTNFLAVHNINDSIFETQNTTEVLQSTCPSNAIYSTEACRPADLQFMCRTTDIQSVLKVALPRIYSSSETPLFNLKYINNTIQSDKKKDYKNFSNCCAACSMHIWHLLIITTKYFGKATFRTLCI
jgi:hypothetical protein